MTLKMTLHEMSLKAQALPEELSPERLEELNAMAAWVAEQPQETPTELTFICTHNSRRSQMGQIWAQAAAWHFGLNDVRTFSGGTEATAFNPRAVRALRGLGVAIDVSKEAINPVYTVQLQSDRSSFEAFSKTYGKEGKKWNPNHGHGAKLERHPIRHVKSSLCIGSFVPWPRAPHAYSSFASPPSGTSCSLHLR